MRKAIITPHIRLFGAHLHVESINFGIKRAFRKTGTPKMDV